MKSLVIIPTFNESQNIVAMIQALLHLDEPELEVMIVDDNSPDGTGDLVEALRSQEPRLHLLRREKKMGLGTAYVARVRYALQRDYEVILEMDVVVGSRYINGVNVVNWPLSRLMLSYFASLYTRWITGIKLRDCTSGFKCFHRRVLQAVNLDSIQSDGYSFQIEMNFRAVHRGFHIREIPIIFIDRRAGTSKMSKRIVREAIWMVWKLKWLQISGRL